MAHPPALERASMLRRASGYAAGSSDTKPEKDDVAGHVCDEDMAELQVARCVDESGDHGQRQKQGRKWTFPTVRTRPKCGCDLLPDRSVARRAFTRGG